MFVIVSTVDGSRQSGEPPIILISMLIDHIWEYNDRPGAFCVVVVTYSVA